MSRTAKAFLVTLSVFGLTLAFIGYIALLQCLPEPWGVVLFGSTIFTGLFFMFRQLVFTND